MPAVHIRLPADALDLLDAQRSLAQGPVRLTRSALAAAFVRQALRLRRRADQARAAALLEKYLPVPRAVAAAWFRRLQGSIPLEELQSAAYEEALKGARRFDPGRLNPETGQPVSPAPYLRTWAERGVQALVRERQEEAQDVRPDGEEGRWERLGGEVVPDSSTSLDLTRALNSFPPAPRRIVLLLAQGAGYDAVAARVGCTTEEVRAAVVALHQHLRTQGIDHTPDEELPLAEAARRASVSPKSLGKRLRAGRLRGRKLNGEWMVFLSEL